MNTLNDLPLSSLKPSKTNPRDDFDSPEVAAYLAELAETIRKPAGVLQPILVRPDYCVGLSSREAIENERPPGGWGCVTLTTPRFEIIAGECRWRASKLAGRATIPSVVTEMTDDDAREAQQIENLKRRGLSPLQEARGIVAMLALKTDAGTPRYTVEGLAEKLGFKAPWVYRRKALLGLSDSGKKALADGTLSTKVASLIITVPEASAREEFTQRILKPELTEGPLSYAEARKVRDEHFVRVLQSRAGSAPFDLEDATLDAQAGACVTCPKMSGNCAALFEGDDNAHLKQRTCMDPACYRRKMAARQKQQREEAEKAGNTMLTGEEAAKIYPFYTTDGAMDPKSPYVQLGSKPAEHLVKKEVTKVPTWEKLVEEAEVATGAKVPRVIIPDQKGVMREHVDMKLAIAAIEKAGEPIFRTAGGDTLPKGGDDPFAVQKKAEAERAKVQWAVAKAALDAVWAALLKGWDSAAVWEELFYVAMQHAGDNGLGIIAKWRELPLKDGEFAKSDAVEIWRNKLSSAERDALVPLLLVSSNMKALGAGAEDFKSFARALKVDLGAIEKKAVADFKAKEKSAQLSPAELEEKVREMMRERKSVATIAVSLGLPLKKAGKIWDKIEKENAAAKAVNDPKILAQWVKARANGMPDEEIARSFKVDVADVKGALAGREGFTPPAPATPVGKKALPKAKAAKKSKK